MNSALFFSIVIEKLVNTDFWMYLLWFIRENEVERTRINWINWSYNFSYVRKQFVLMLCCMILCHMNTVTWTWLSLFRLKRAKNIKQDVLTAQLY